MAAQERPYQPPLPWRMTSALTVGTVGLLSRTFLYAFNNTQVNGLDRLLQILDSRKDEKARTRGLITVSNHVSVLDDPMIWGILPFRYQWDTNNVRWSLGSYDICFKNSLTSAFFSYGQTLPTHRAAYSAYGGLFQPTITQVIRLLSDPHGNAVPSKTENDFSSRRDDSSDLASFPKTDPFSASELTYSTTGSDSFPAPSAYPYRRFSWVHIFPEGMIHQHPDKVMRYFKWGVARLILEAEPCPDILPMWIDGPQQVMHENRPWPRPFPRPGQQISVNFGELVDTENVFGPFRERWRALKQKVSSSRSESRPNNSHAAESSTANDLGVVTDDLLKYGAEAEQLRIEVTLAVRNEVLKVRRACGFADEDPKRGLADTFRQEGGKEREGVKDDGSIVKEM